MEITARISGLPPAAGNGAPASRRHAAAPGAGGRRRRRGAGRGLALLLALAAWTGAAWGQADPASGAGLYAQDCAVCHGPRGQGKIGPSLQAAHDAQPVLAMIRGGKGMMPPFAQRLTPAQMQAVADYVSHTLATVALTGGNLSEGGVLFRVNCAPCHRTDARGGALAFTQHNAPALTGFSAATIAGAIRGGRGPMPAFPPTVFNDRQLASIVSYVRFVQHPPTPGGYPADFLGPVAEGLIALLMVAALGVIAYWIEFQGRG
jgi:ubiquinol-cytochrome c reductase cytochrome c subunit